MANKLIVTVAPTSNFHGKDANPALPFSPEEVADAVYLCWQEGASIVHIHGRDERGLPTNDPAFFQKADALIREKKCDIIIEHSMAPANPALLGEKRATSMTASGRPRRRLPRRWRAWRCRPATSC